MAGHELHWPGGHNSSAVLASTTALRGLKQGLKCPRCDSSNTKFCYYNNYSLSQPRHFCKTCRRYWTEGGALRDVPLGGGCRKNKKFRSLMGASLHGIGLPPIIPRLTDHHQLASEPAVLFSPTDAAGFNCPPIDIAAVQACGSTVGGNAINPSSIELLSSINQDLHWNLQRQRLAVVFGEELTPNEAILPSAPERTPALAACGGSGSRDPQDSSAWPSECSHYAMLPSSAVASIRNTSSSDMSSTSYWNGEVQFLHGMTSPSPSSPHRCLRED